MTLYCDVDGTLLDSSARHEKLLRDLLAARGLLWPAAAPDYLRYKADGHSTKAWLMLAGFAPEICAELLHCLRQTEIDKECLHQNWCSADDPDIKFVDPIERFNF